MAGLYLVWVKGLARKSEVVRIARATGRDRRQVAATLMEFWEWAEDNTIDGRIEGVRVCNLPGLIDDTGASFWAAVVAVNWLRPGRNSIEIPHFERWMGRSAKRRLRENARKQGNRAPESVRNLSASHADKNGTTEQNRTEQKNKPPPPPPAEGGRSRETRKDRDARLAAAAAERARAERARQAEELRLQNHVEGALPPTEVSGRLRAAGMVKEKT